MTHRIFETSMYIFRVSSDYTENVAASSSRRSLKAGPEAEEGSQTTPIETRRRTSSRSTKTLIVNPPATKIETVRVVPTEQTANASETSLGGPYLSTNFDPATINGPIYECKYCKLLFPTLQTTREHVSKDHPKQFECEVCSKKFRSIEAVFEHKESHFRGKENSAIPDSKLTPPAATPPTQQDAPTVAHYTGPAPPPANSVSDLLNAPPGATYKCKYCDLVFWQLKVTVDHIATFHPKVFNCNICTEKFRTNDELEDHKQKHFKAVELDKQKREARRVKCEVCGRMISDARALVNHMRTHTGDRPYQCNICEKRFIVPALLKNHMNMHNNSWPHVCVHCGRGFDAMNKLVEHERLHTGERPFVCEVCNRGFRTKVGLKSHIDVHDDLGKHACAHCGKRFRSKETLRSHLKVHGPPHRPHKCPICGLCFRSRYYLHNMHLALHSNEHPVQCDMCHKTFPFKHSLTKHMRVHFGEKSNICEICGKAFLDRIALDIHRRIHTGEKPYTCEVCGQRFSQRSSMMSHRRRHENALPFQCDLCARGFDLERQLMNHRRRCGNE
jgi:uncharacterized Zn-finger protein